MHPILRFAKTAYVEAQNLRVFLKDYTNPDDFISRLVKKGELIRLKNGFFLIGEKIEERVIPFESIANLLHGPSYVSLEWALSFYRMIPEGVYVVTSVSTTKSKTFSTPVGTFDYVYLSHKRYAIGIDQKEGSSGRFLIATPEKALADLVHRKSRNMNPKDLLVDLLEGRRMDKDLLKNLDRSHVMEIANNYRSQAVSNLVNVLGRL